MNQLALGRSIVLNHTASTCSNLSAVSYIEAASPEIAPERTPDRLRAAAAVSKRTVWRVYPMADLDSFDATLAEGHGPTCSIRGKQEQPKFLPTRPSSGSRSNFGPDCVLLTSPEASTDMTSE